MTLRRFADGDAVRRRVLAYVADAMVVGSSLLAVASRLGRTRRERARLAAGLGLVVATLYHVLLEGAFGRTVGKHLLGVAVVGEDGEPCTFSAAAVRTAFRFADWLPAGYLAGFAAIARTERDQRLGDLAAGTVVVHRDRERARDRD